MTFVAHELRGDTERSCRVHGWELAKPLPAPLLWRLRAAWLVVKGEAEIVVWPCQRRSSPGAGREHV